jgi:hypothetical protein
LLSIHALSLRTEILKIKINTFLHSLALLAVVIVVVVLTIYILTYISLFLNIYIKKKLST